MCGLSLLFKSDIIALKPFIYLDYFQVIFILSFDIEDSHKNFAHEVRLHGKVDRTKSYTAQGA